MSVFLKRDGEQYIIIVNDEADIHRFFCTSLNAVIWFLDAIQEQEIMPLAGVTTGDRGYLHAEGIALRSIKYIPDDSGTARDGGYE